MTEQQIFKHSYVFLNYVFSIYQGIFVYENVLMRLKHPQSDKAKYMDVQEKMKKVVEWFQNLWENKPLLTEPEASAEIQLMLEECLKELNSFQKTAECLEQNNGELEDADLVVALGIIAKTAYIQENFLNGLIAYCEHLNLESDADHWRQKLPVAGNDTDRAGYYLTRFESGLDDRLRHDIESAFKGYSQVFRTYLNEITQWLKEYHDDMKS